MGAWGPAIFSDDLAADLREDFKEYIGDGLSAEEATAKLIAEHQESINDSDDGPTFWVSLALTQWKMGRLLPDVLARALDIIDKGKGLDRWEEDPKLLPKRLAVLSKTRAQLVSDQPPARKVAKRFRDSNNWPVGAIVSYRLLSGRICLFRVIGHHADKGGTAPIVELLDWVGIHPPGHLKVRFLRVKVEAKPRGTSQFMIGATSAKQFPTDRVALMGVKLRPDQKPGGFSVFLWSYLDELLKSTFELD